MSPVLPPGSPARPTAHHSADYHADFSMAEAVLVPQTAMPDTAQFHDETKDGEENEGNLAEHHEALLGAEFRNPVNVNKQPTIATLGDTPFEDSGGDETIEHRRIVATEVVSNVEYETPEAILQNAIVLLDPRIPDCCHLVDSARSRGLMVMAVVPKPAAVGVNVSNSTYYPTAEELLEVGMHQVYEPPVGNKFDVVECATNLNTIEAQQNLRFLGVVPCRESAVDYCDILGALLGLAVVNDLGLAGARRDKGLMKAAVANAGLRVAKYARLTMSDGSDVRPVIEELEIEYPVVVKTPRGMSSMDVFICQDAEEAVQRSGQIVRNVGPDGRRTQYALLEEFLGGEEFAVNLLASPTTPRGVQVTDVWMYHKIETDGTMVNTYQEMVDPHDKAYASLIKYAEGVCRAVGIKYGMAHVELKAHFNHQKGRWVDPCMIEVGARLAGGRKAIMAEATIPSWNPFDAMVDAHCGFPVRMPPSFSPLKKAVHVFVPSDKAGILKSVKGDDFERLETYNMHIMIRKVGDEVQRAMSIMSFAGFVWLIGEEADVKRDIKLAREEFVVEVDPIPEVEQKSNEASSPS